MTTNYFRLITIFFFCNLSTSCNKAKYKNRDILESITAKVDKIRLSYYDEKDTLISFVTDKQKIDLICNLIDGKVDTSIKQCNPSGQILYYSDNEIVLESFFSIGNGCEQLSYFLSPQRYNTKLTYRAGMFLAEYLNSLK